MAKSLSEDLRIRLIVAVEAGMSRRAAAERFGVAVASAIRWVGAWRATGATGAKPQGGDQRSYRIEAFKDVILARIDVQVDITLVELADWLRTEHGTAFAPSTIWRFLDSHDMTFKKRARIGRPACGVGNWSRYLEAEGSGRTVFGGLDPVKKPGPWAVADLRVVTPSGDPD
jgi:transposase